MRFLSRGFKNLQWYAMTKTVSSVLLEAVFICGKLGELKPDLTTIVHLAIQLSYYAMSNLQHSLRARAGGLFVLAESVGADIRRGGGLAWSFRSRSVKTFGRMSCPRSPGNLIILCFLIE